MLIASAKFSEREGSISPSSFYAQLLDYQSQALSTQQMHSSCCWCKSKKLRGRGSPRFSCIAPVVESFSSDLLRANNKLLGRGLAFNILSNIPSNIHNGALLRKQPMALINTLTISAKMLTADVRLHSKCVSDWRYCKYWVQVDCKCMEFVTTG